MQAIGQGKQAFVCGASTSRPSMAGRSPYMNIQALPL